MKMLVLAPLVAATALAGGCAATGSDGYDDGGYGYYDSR